MRVARTLSLDTTVIERVPAPEPGPGEVVCRILACATCGSDVQDWYVERKLPAVLGHEPVGEVVAGDALPAGTRVAIHHHAPCRRCDRCRRGHETLCEQYRRTALDPGGFAEQVRISAELVGELLPIGDMDPVLATFVEPLGCVLRAQRRLGLTADDALLVVGAGCSGLLHVAAAPGPVAVLEPDPARRAHAVRWGATAWAGEPVGAAVVTTTHPQAILAAAEALGPGGRLCLYAPPAPGSPLGIDGNAVFSRELTVTASWSAGPQDMRAALALLASGAVAPLELVGLRVGLDETGRALTAQKSGAVYKAVVVP